jgi:spermidine synthase
MAIPWQTIDRVPTPDGELELRQRGGGDFLITIAGRVLMNSRANRSELALATLVCEELVERAGIRMMIGGLGMGCTLRAALDGLSADAEITLCELNATIERWCRGPLSVVNGRALEDPRTSLLIDDVAHAIRDHADDRSRPRLDAIVLDLYEGPHSRTHPKRDPFYGSQALDTTRRALAIGGIFAIWSEVPDEAYEKRLRRTGFSLELHRAGRGGLRHAVYLARRKR